MAEVQPFKGLRFNAAKAGKLADIITPPFDVISESDQSLFYERSPYNMVRLIRGKTTAYDTRGSNPHSRASDYLKQWIQQGVLQQDPEEAFYLTTLEFPFGDSQFTRYGLIGRVELKDFSEGVVLPHEKTFTNVKAERLGLVNACRANFSPIFSLFDDPADIVGDWAELAGSRKHLVKTTDHNGWRHRLWQITDKDLIARTTRYFKDRKLYIADGHHRYETALNYRNSLGAELPRNHPATFTMMYMCSMRDSGLIILPAHRLLKEVARPLLDGFVERAREFFDVKTLPYAEDRRDSALTELISILHASPADGCIGAFMKRSRQFIILKLKHGGIMKQMFSDELPEAIGRLDVTVLTRLIFMELLGFDQNRLDNEKLIGYTTAPKEAVDAVVRGEYDITFILNPPSLRQVCDVADRGLVMPRKATYFFPKVITGLVMNLLYER
ncbi:MAG: hypothetical protein AMJ54_10265 [Deltaproteobacteria bacterium SG8_13]|nr:MAG: hypothetical protein AMJ54_10265 [Deltaproteobacteria bacterium SG8_13]